MESPDYNSIKVRPAPNFKPQRVVVVGATGVVGSEVLSILSERAFPHIDVRVLASSRSAGQSVSFDDEELTIGELTAASLEGADIVFFAAGGQVSKEFCPIAAKQGAVCIDKSSVFRMDDAVPLVVPGVNTDALAGYDAKNIVATPNCSTTQLVQVLAPLHKEAELERVVVSTYQAVSGAGKAGIDELDTQVREMFNMRDITDMEVFKRRIAFNALPCIPGAAAFSGEHHATTEEQKMIDETRKILGLPDLRVGVTCVRIPVFNGHSESVHMEFKNAISRDRALELLRETPNVAVMDDPEQHLYPTPQDAVGQDDTFVGRVRVDPSAKHGLALFCVSDNLRTGAALNAVRIAEQLCEHHLS